MQHITGGGRYLFPHRSGKGFTTPNRLTYAMRDMNLGRGTTPHCWRTIFSTWANENGYHPVVFCRYVATAHYVAEHLKAAFPKATIEAVTGELTPEERRERVDDMENADQRILIATDCLSEGVNLQHLFSLPCRRYFHRQSLPPVGLTSRNKPPPSESFQSRSVDLADLTLRSVSRFSGIVGLHCGEMYPHG